MRRFFRLLKLILKISFIEQTSYPPSFWFAIVGKALRIGLLIIFYQAIFATVPVFAHWTQSEAILLVGVFSLIETSMSITFHRNFAYHLAEDIHDGTFDHVLVKPVPTLLAVGLKRIDSMDFATLIPVAIVLRAGLKLNHIAYTVHNLALGTYFLLLGYLFLLAVYLIIGALTFKSVIGGGPGRLAEQVTRMGQVPTDIYSGTSRLVLTYLLPIILLGTAPVQALLGHPVTNLIWPSLLTVGLLTAISYTYWKRGLDSYTSANG